MLVSEPLDNLTVDRVAADAAVSRGLVFHYFPTVRELQLACLAEVAAGLAGIIGEAAAHGDADERLRRGLDAFIGYVRQRPRTFETLATYAAGDRDFGQVFEMFRMQMVELIGDRAGMPDDPLISLLLRSWVSFTETAVLQWSRDEPVDRGDLLEMLIVVTNDIQEQWKARISVD
ncbi:MAG: TetR/AcrR family transcriptional regulator [Acidimicrobiia bacterium]|nr:TetR/AcrR family transcriptional regulator [Acidimicrobiia bacterium]